MAMMHLSSHLVQPPGGLTGTATLLHSRGFTGTGWMLSDDSDKFSPGEQLRAGSRDRMKGSMELWEAESLGIYSDL